MESKKRLRIAVDLDDTIWKYHKKLFEYYGEKLGWKERVEDYHTYNLEKFLGIPLEEAHKLFDDFEFSEASWDVDLVEGVVESLKKLNEEHDVFLITSRHEGLKERTKEKVLKFLGMDLPIYHTYDKDKKKIREKHEVCNELGINILIDDGFHHIKKSSGNGIKCLLMDAPWNQVDELPEGIIRVKDWKEIMENLGVEDE